jgi:hypothetical protein
MVLFMQPFSILADKYTDYVGQVGGHAWHDLVCAAKLVPGSLRFRHFD